MKKKKQKAKRSRSSNNNNKKSGNYNLSKSLVPLVSPPDYSLTQGDALYSEVVVEAHIRISNDQIRRAAYAVEMRIDPSLSEQIPDSWGMVRFTEVSAETGIDSGPGEIFITRRIASANLSGNFLHFAEGGDESSDEPTASDFLNSKIERAIAELIELHRANISAKAAQSKRKRNVKKKVAAVVERKGP